MLKVCSSSATHLQHWSVKGSLSFRKLTWKTCDVQHILSTASLLLDNLVAWIQLYFHTALAVGNISDLGLARSNCYRSAAPAHLPALPRSTKLTPRMCRRSSGVRTVTICPIFCHRKGGGSQTISAVNCFQPGCENTRLCQEVVLDDTLKFSSSLSTSARSLGSAWRAELRVKPISEAQGYKMPTQ